jgi:hypothetical protein
MLAEMIGVSREVMPPTPILIDNTGALKLIQDAIQHTANKQILHHLHELRERILAGRFYAVKVSTDDNLADAGTKQLATAEASRRILAFLAAPLGERPIIIHALHIIDAMLKARQQWQASRPVHAHASERIGEASHPGPTGEPPRLRPSSKRRLGNVISLEDEAGSTARQKRLLSLRTASYTPSPAQSSTSSTTQEFNFELHTTSTPLGVELNPNVSPAVIQHAASQGIHFAFRTFKYEEGTPEELEFRRRLVDVTAVTSDTCEPTNTPSLGQGGMLDG